MGEVAENMLDGTLCCECGVFLGLDTGYPIQCSSCKPKRVKKKKFNINIKKVSK